MLNKMYLALLSVNDKQQQQMQCTRGACTNICSKAHKSLSALLYRYWSRVANHSREKTGLFLPGQSTNPFYRDVVYIGTTLEVGNWVEIQTQVRAS